MVFSTDVRCQFADATTRKLDIMLIPERSDGCNDLPDTIYVIYDGRDSNVWPATRDTNIPCHYTTPVKGTGDAFTIGRTVFSLRLGIARTDCRVASYINEDVQPFRRIGTLSFPFKPRSAYDLTVTMSPDRFTASYDRRFPKIPKVAESLACYEPADIDKESLLRDVMFDRETVGIQFAGIEIFVDSNLQVSLNDPKLKKTILDPDEIGRAHKRQNGNATLPDATLHVSANQKETIAGYLKRRGLTKVTLTRE